MEDQGHGHDYQPARKRQKLSNDAETDSEDNLDTSWSDSSARVSNFEYGFMQKILAEEFDLEISLRQRLASTIKSRIAWASILQNSLFKDVHDSNNPDVSYNFQDIAKETLQDIEAPFEFIFNTGIDTKSGSFMRSGVQLNLSTQSSKTFAQPRTRSHRIRGRSIIQSFTSGSKLLFIRDNSSSPRIIAKMACPDCSREDFTNIQGLLNHCRIRHSKDYGSHDECMQRCAVIVPEEDRDWVLTNGTELASVGLPSLRRLFEIAVGNIAVTIARCEIRTTEDGSPKEEMATGNHLSRTLGLHKDTPALAPFLGRTPRRRCINVYNEDDDVDIGIQNPRMDSAQPTWRMSYAHRNKAESGFDVVVEPNMPQTLSSALSTTIQQRLPEAAKYNGTRFHVLARVVLSDRSLWLPPGRRGLSCPPDHTHRWMLSIDSTSYSLHITAFLAKITMTCLTDPPPYALFTTQSISVPPFIFFGTTGKPFLACLTFEWAGTHNPPMEVQHWVELDLSKAANPILGDEQVLDIELDRNTELLPVVLDYKLPLWDAANVLKEIKPNDKLSISTSNIEPAYFANLRSLLPLVPMTLKDVKGRAPTQLPYKLVSNPAQFRSLVLGRRKAIEWGRARSLLSEYQKYVKFSQQDEAALLTTADVYCWMVDEGLFLRDTPKKRPTSVPEDVHKDKLTSESASFHSAMSCPDCGLSHELPKQRSPMDPSDCPYVRCRMNRLATVDLGRILSPPSAGRASQQTAIIPLKSDRKLRHDLVAISDPALILAVRDVVAALHLETFRTAHGRSSIFPLTELGTNATEIEKHIAPFAILSFATRAFLDTLIKGGLNVAHQDWSINHERKAEFRVLTPSHIIRGMYSSTHSEMRAALACCLRFGVPLEHAALGNLDAGTCGLPKCGDRTDHRF